MKHDPNTKRAAAEALRALTAGAMALPGLAGSSHSAHADGPVTETTVEGDYSYYREDKLRPRKTLPGNDRKRFDIDSYQFRLSTPLNERADLDASGTFETLSGASPWFVQPDLVGDRNGRPVQVMSGATIDENRGDLLVTGNYYLDAGKLSGSGGFSIENDYYSVNLGLAAERSFADKNTTLSIGVSGSYDWIRPTDCQDYSTRVCKDDKQTLNAYLGLSQILTRHSAIQSTISFGWNTGFLSDPYKLAYIDSVGGELVADSRPDDRKQFTWLTKYRHHVSRLDGTLHFDYKLYVDDWSINSHTFDLAWYQSLPWQIQVVPSFRYYSQSQAEFYEVYYEQARSDGLASSDYRLSPYGAISYGLKLTKDWSMMGSDWQAALSYERYQSSAGMAFQRVDVENPGLVSFRVFAIRLTTHF